MGDFNIDLLKTGENQHTNDILKWYYDENHIFPIEAI